MKALKREREHMKDKEKGKAAKRLKGAKRTFATSPNARTSSATLSPGGLPQEDVQAIDSDDEVRYKTASEKLSHKIERDRRAESMKNDATSALTPHSSKKSTELIALILKAPNGKVKQVVHKAEATIREVLAAHGKDPLQYRFLFNGHRVSRDVSVQELQRTGKKSKGGLTLQLEKLVYVEIYLGDNVFEERLPGSMPITKLFEDLKLRGLEKNITDLVCQNSDGVEFGKELTLDELDQRSGYSKNKPLALHIVHADWDSD